MKRKVLSLILASALLVSNSFSVFASQEIGNSIEAIEYQEVNEDEPYDETSVEATIAFQR